MQAGDAGAMDDLVAVDMVNHAAGPQGRAGLRAILDVIETDIGPVEVDHHHLVAEGELVAHHMTMRGHHRASTMPLLAGTPATGQTVTWTYMHLWRVVDGQIVEHWACRDDLGLLAQIGAWPPPP
jgi:lactoylglutathione lyase